MEEQGQNNTEQIKLSIPLAIVLSGIIIAGAIVYIGSDPRGESVAQNDEQAAAVNLAPPSPKDHTLGDPRAPVIIVEFSDLECPFCKSFHKTMKQAMAEYGDERKIAWVYRHFPLEGIHSKARKEAEATECAGELGGEAKFWEYVDEVFEITPSNNGLDLTLLPKIASQLGLNREAFEVCLQGGKYTAAIDEDIKEAIDAGARGTPYSLIVVTKSGKTTPVNGAVEFPTIKKMIEDALSE